MVNLDNSPNINDLLSYDAYTIYQESQAFYLDLNLGVFSPGFWWTEYDKNRWKMSNELSSLSAVKKLS